MKNRLRSKTAWISSITLLLFVLKTYFDINIEETEELITLLTTFCVAFGIWNNPKDGDNF